MVKIYRDNKFDAVATYKPVIRDAFLDFAKKVDYSFVNGHWPKEDLQQ